MGSSTLTVLSVLFLGLALNLKVLIWFGTLGAAVLVIISSVVVSHSGWKELIESFKN